MVFSLWISQLCILRILPPFLKVSSWMLPKKYRRRWSTHSFALRFEVTIEEGNGKQRLWAWIGGDIGMTTCLLWHSRAQWQRRWQDVYLTKDWQCPSVENLVSAENQEKLFPFPSVDKSCAIHSIALWIPFHIKQHYKFFGVVSIIHQVNNTLQIQCFDSHACFFTVS